MKRCLKQISKEREVIRCVWTQKEDNALREAATKYKGECWNLVAEEVKKVMPLSVQPKTSKQCRERWNNQLNPKVELSPLTETEIRKIFVLHGKFGNSWSKISVKLQGRTDNIVKNYFLCRLRRLARCLKSGGVNEATPKNEEDLIHTLYLLDYLYKYYISPEREDNIRKSLNAQTMRRKNRGDKYINKVIATDKSIIKKLSSFTKDIIKSAKFPIDKGKLKAYEFITNPETNSCLIGSSNTSNALHSDDLNSTLSKLIDNPLALPNTIELSKLQLPIPNFKQGTQKDDFIPTFMFTPYSLPCLSGLYQKGLIREHFLSFSN